MTQDLEPVCKQHPEGWDCPDALVVHLPSGYYGLIVHDGGASSIIINFCPWCGADLARFAKLS